MSGENLKAFNQSHPCLSSVYEEAYKEDDTKKKRKTPFQIYFEILSNLFYYLLMGGRRATQIPAPWEIPQPLRCIYRTPCWEAKGEDQTLLTCPLKGKSEIFCMWWTYWDVSLSESIVQVRETQQQNICINILNVYLTCSVCLDL